MAHLDLLGKEWRKVAQRFREAWFSNVRGRLVQETKEARRS